MPPEQPLLPSIPPVPRTNVEGNIVEHPIWKLTNRHAKPLRPMIDKATGKPGFYADPEDYKLVLELGPAPDNAALMRRLELTASIHHGFPTMFAFRVLVAIIEKASILGYISQKVAITPTEIARAVGIENPGGSAYRSIYDALNALEGVHLCYVDTYYDITKKRVQPGRRTERLVKRSVFQAQSSSPAPQTPPLPNLADERAAPAAAAAAEPAPDAEPLDFVELGDGLWESLTAGYRFPVDREYLNLLESEVAQRLYSYLAKKTGRSSEYREAVVSLGRRIGIALTAPAHIMRSLKPALSVFTTPLGPKGIQFLASYRFEGTRQATQLVVKVQRPRTDETAEQDARGRAMVEELARKWKVKNPSSPRE